MILFNCSENQLENKSNLETKLSGTDLIRIHNKVKSEFTYDLPTTNISNKDVMEKDSSVTIEDNLSIALTLEKNLLKMFLTQIMTMF